MQERAPSTIHELAGATDGWLSAAEGDLLYRLALRCRSGCIVEIGSWQGKSTTFLGSGSKAGGRVAVYAVDPHLEPPGPEVRSRLFQRQMELAQLTDIVLPIVSPSADAAQLFTEPIELLFIDGAHDDFSVRQDWDLWVRKVIPGGYVVMHDTLLYPVPRKIAGKRILQSKDFVETGLADSITYGRVRRRDEAEEGLPHRLRIVALKRACDMAVRMPLPPVAKRWGSRVLDALQR